MYSGNAISSGNVIWVDFRLSKDIRNRQAISFGERMRDSSERTRKLLRHSEAALATIRHMLDEKR